MTDGTIRPCFIVRLDYGRPTGFFVDKNGDESEPINSIEDAVSYIVDSRELSNSELREVATDILVLGRQLPLMANYRFWNTERLSAEQNKFMRAIAIQLFEHLIGVATGYTEEIK